MMSLIVAVNTLMPLQSTPTLEQVRVNYDDDDVNVVVKPWLKVCT
jgi:hypothetical protein